MAKSGDSKTESLVKAFAELQLPAKEESASEPAVKDKGKSWAEETFPEDEGQRTLRSGSKHLRVPADAVKSRIPTPPPLPSKPPVARIMNPHTATQPSTIPPSMYTTNTGPIKLLPTSASIREFSGTEPGFSAREYINLCEDVMGNSCVTEPGDKISFVRSRLQPGSRASNLMQASSFTKPLENKDYQSFRNNFLETFGDNAQQNLVKGVNFAVEKLLAEATTKDIFEGQVDANRISADFMKYLEDNGWTQGDTMTTSNVCKFLEFFMYMFLIKGTCRRNTLSLEFPPTTELHRFVLRLKTKLEEKDGGPRMAASAVAVTHSQEGDAPNTSSYAAVTASGKPTYICSYCQRSGHTISRCFERIKEQRMAQRQKSSSASASAAPSSSPSFQRKDRNRNEGTAHLRKTYRSTYVAVPERTSPSPRSATGGSPYCVIHKSTSHATNDCFTVQKFINAQEGRGTSGKQSGEAARTVKKEPG